MFSLWSLRHNLGTSGYCVFDCSPRNHTVVVPHARQTFRTTATRVGIERMGVAAIGRIMVDYAAARSRRAYTCHGARSVSHYGSGADPRSLKVPKDSLSRLCLEIRLVRWHPGGQRLFYLTV